MTSEEVTGEQGDRSFRTGGGRPAGASAAGAPGRVCGSLGDRRERAPDFARRFWDAAYADEQDLHHWQRASPDPALVRATEGRAAGRALDIGCGVGLDAEWLATLGWTVIGLDLSLTALARSAAGSARESAGVSSWSALAGSAFELPLADGCLDLVVDAGCLHSIGKASRSRYAREVARVTRADGLFLVRGSRIDDEESGLVGVGAGECRRWLEPDFAFVSAMKVELTAEAGDLDGVAVLWRKRG